MKKPGPVKTLVGWREWVGVPSLGVPHVKAKVDTGARTSALHAFDVETFSRKGQVVVRFAIHPFQRRERPVVRAEAPVVGLRNVVSSNGSREKRIVIRTVLAAAGVEWPIELTLTNRDQMGFRMLLGREAIKPRFVVDPAKSYCLGRPELRLRKPK